MSSEVMRHIALRTHRFVLQYDLFQPAKRPIQGVQNSTLSNSLNVRRLTEMTFDAVFNTKMLMGTVCRQMRP